jgi:hypothetical protein
MGNKQGTLANHLETATKTGALAFPDKVITVLCIIEGFRISFFHLGSSINSAQLDIVDYPCVMILILMLSSSSKKCDVINKRPPNFFHIWNNIQSLDCQTMATFY